MNFMVKVTIFFCNDVVEVLQSKTFEHFSVTKVLMTVQSSCTQREENKTSFAE